MSAKVVQLAMLSPSAKSVVFLFATALAGACSLLNRTGPSVTCNELGQGATNACAEGIVASCVGGQVVYDVCEDEGACAASWQKPGRYSCTSSGVLPPAPDASTPLQDADPSADTRPTDATSEGSPEASSCDPGANCLLAATDGSDIQAYFADATHAYFSDCCTVWRVPLEGGARSVVATEATSGTCVSRGSLFGDATHIFLLRNEASKARIVRAPKTGGSFETILSSISYLYAMTVDSDALYWSEVDKLYRSSKAAPDKPTLLASGRFDDPYARLIVDESNVYWTAGTSMFRIAKTGAASSTATPLNAKSDGKTLAVDKTSAYVTASSDGALWRVPLSGGPAATYLRGEGETRYAVVDGTQLYFGSRGDAGARIRKSGLGLADAAATTVVEVRGSDMGFMAVSGAYVIWREGPIIARSPK